MPPRPRRGTGQLVFHVFNRAIQDVVLFLQSSDYDTFVRLLEEAADRFPVRVLAYAVMPNHWHLVLWPTTDGGLSACMHWLTATHAKRWRVRWGTTGRGAVYQSRFKAIAVQADDHYLTVCRYVERNPLRAGLVERAEHWPWSSASVGVRPLGSAAPTFASAAAPVVLPWPASPSWASVTSFHPPATATAATSFASAPVLSMTPLPLFSNAPRPTIANWPVPKPVDWLDLLNEAEEPATTDALRETIRKGLPFGTPGWQLRAMRRLRWRFSTRRPGRPRSERHSVDMGRLVPRRTSPNVPSM